MALRRLWLSDFRCFGEALFEPAEEGLTVLRGPNGAGKTSVLEAVAWLAQQRSFRTSSREVLVRQGAERAVLRAEVHDAERHVTLESLLPLAGPVRTLLNRQPVQRRVQVADVHQVTLFSPADLELVQGGPAGRRGLLDDLLASGSGRHEETIATVERALRHRAALLRQVHGRLDDDARRTLDVFDARLADAGSALAEAREALVGELAPLADIAYRSLAGDGEKLALRYRRSWQGDLAVALAAARASDLRRGASTVGPQRDELELEVSGRAARAYASQGEQRCAALALRLAGFEVARARALHPPVLLLDDVFSELDRRRSTALIEWLPAGQVLLSTAGDLPEGVAAAQVVEVSAGTLARGS